MVDSLEKICLRAFRGPVLRAVSSSGDFAGTFNSTELLPQVIEDNVAYVPGEFFHADGTGKKYYAFELLLLQSEKINEGISRLGKAFKKKS